MSKLNQKLGLELVERIAAMTQHPGVRIHIKRRLLELKAEDRDRHLKYLEEMATEQGVNDE